MTTLLVIGTFLASVSWLLASAWPEKVSRSVSGEFGAKDCVPFVNRPGS